MAATKALLAEKLQRWKGGMEEKGLRLNVCKTKVMKCRFISDQIEKSGKWPCRICKKGVAQTPYSALHVTCGSTIGAAVYQDSCREYLISVADVVSVGNP